MSGTVTKFILRFTIVNVTLAHGGLATRNFSVNTVRSSGSACDVIPSVVAGSDLAETGGSHCPMFSAFLGVLWARELGAVGRIVSALQQRIVSCPLPNSFKSVTHRGLVKKTASPNVSTAISDSCRRVQLVV